MRPGDSPVSGPVGTHQERSWSSMVLGVDLALVADRCIEILDELCSPASKGFGAGRTCTRGSRSDGALEIAVRTGITMDRHVLGYIELQPLDVVVKRYGVRADIGNRRPCRGRAHVRVNENLRLRQIHDRHVAGMIEAFHMVADDRLIAVADR